MCDLANHFVLTAAQKQALDGLGANLDALGLDSAVKVSGAGSGVTQDGADRLENIGASLAALGFIRFSSITARVERRRLVTLR